MTAIYTAARAAYKAGLCVIPPRENGSKQPVGEWEKYQVERPGRDQMRAWYGSDEQSCRRTGIGVVTGAVSGDLETLDFDDRATFDAYKARAEEWGLSALLLRVLQGYSEHTPNGAHLFWRCPPVADAATGELIPQIEGSKKLARRPNPTPDNSHAIDTLIETKGEGGFIITAPTNGKVHPSGGRYTVLNGEFATIASISPNERADLLDLARSFDEMPEEEPSEPKQSTTVEGDRPGDLFNERASWADVLEPHGWTAVFTRNGTTFWRRPGKSHSWSATTGRTERDTLMVFSSSTPFDCVTDNRRSYSKFAAYAVLNHHGDMSAAAKDLYSKGYVSGTSEGFEGAQEEPWENIGDIPEECEPVPTLPEWMLPEALKPWICDIANRVSIPVEFVAVPAITALGSVIGRRVGIRPVRFDDFTVVPNLWGSIIGRPGVMKSAAVTQAIAPLDRLAAIARDKHTEEMGEWRIRKVELESELAFIKQRLKSSGEADEHRERLREVLEELENGEPVARRYSTQDATVEKLGEILANNPNGILIARDELSGWLRSMDKPGREGDREFYLEAWNGSGGYTFDRIGRGTIHIPSVCLSIIGGIQPGKLRSYVNGAVAGDWGDDGLLQRLQMIVWPDSMDEWREVAHWPNGKAKANAYEVFEYLDALEPETIGAESDEHTHNAIPFLRFDRSGQEVFNTWRRELEGRLRSNQLDSAPSFESHIAKYRSLMPSLALVFHLVERRMDGVGELATQMAAEWCDFLEQHARKIYTAELRPNYAAAHALAAKIREGAVIDGDTTRSIYLNDWKGLTDAESVRGALRILGTANWVRIERVETRGRPSEVVRLHPSLRGLPE